MSVLLASLLTVILGVTGLSRTDAAWADSDPCEGSVSIGDFVMWDGDMGGSAQVPVTATIACAYSRIITYRTFDMTAKAGTDYQAVLNGRVVLNPGETSAKAVVEVAGKSMPEPPKRFGVRLLSGALFADPEAVVTIIVY